MRSRVPTPRQSDMSGINSAKHVPKPYKLRNFYIPSEVAKHNTHDDIWVSFFHKVYDLTLLVHDNYTSPLVDPIVLAAGTDITHWFDAETRQVRLSERTNKKLKFSLVAERKLSSSYLI